MTKRQHRALQSYVEVIQERLRLRDWEVFVTPEEPENEAHLASIFTHWARRVANVSFRADFFSLAPKYQRECVIHELLHCAFAHTQHHVEHVLPPLCKSAPAAQLYIETFFHAHEYSIDTLSVAIAPLCPLPEIPK